MFKKFIFEKSPPITPFVFSGKAIEKHKWGGGHPPLPPLSVWTHLLIDFKILQSTLFILLCSYFSKRK
jgi:hypothetical protein